MLFEDRHYAVRRQGCCAAGSTSTTSSCVARDLLRAKPEVAAGYRERFAEVMVDEFQDTNRLQVELVELVCGGDLFLVGDEFQSIYRFRRADVEVYREQRAEAGDAVIALDENYRSRPHVLDLVNEVVRPRVRRRLPRRWWRPAASTATRRRRRWSCC